MSDPRRWLDSDSAPHGALDLLRHAHAPTPLDAATRARSRRRVVAMTVVPAAASVMFWFKSIALGAVLGSAVTVAVVVPKWRAEPDRQTAAPQGVHRSAPVAPMSSATQPTIERRAVSPTEAPELTPSAPAMPSPSVPNLSAPSTTKASPAPSITPISSDDLGREIQLLERARQLLSANPALALETLGQHRREFGNGTLVLERQFLEVDALLRLGHHAEARARAANLRRRAPGSLYEQRLSKLLDDKSE